MPQVVLEYRKAMSSHRSVLVEAFYEALPRIVMSLPEQRLQTSILSRTSLVRLTTLESHAYS